MKTVLCTGMSGSGRRECLTEILESTPPSGYEWMFLDVGDIMFELDQQNGKMPTNGFARSRWEDAILKREPALSYQRRAAHERILAEVARARERESQYDAEEMVVIVSTHALFHHSFSRVVSLESDWLEDLEPDLIITIVDDILRVKENLKGSGQQRWMDIPTHRLLDWREEEHLITRMAAAPLRKDHYLVPRKRARTIIYDLIFHPEKAPIYVSYPMTFVQGRPEIRQEVQRLTRELGQWFVVFDPADITDLENEKQLLADIQRESMREGRDLAFHEAEQIRLHLRGQTVGRDHALIEQSRGVVVYYPVLRFEVQGDGKHGSIEEVPPFSSGVLDEILYATELGKEVYLIWMAQASPGPFLEDKCNSRVKCPDELLGILGNQTLGMDECAWLSSSEMFASTPERVASLSLS